MVRQTHVEPMAYRVELLRTAFGSLMPLAIMTALFVATGLHAALRTHDPVIAWLTVAGAFFLTGKLLLHLAFCRARRANRDAPQVDAWTRAFGIANLACAATLGALVARTFVVADPTVQLIGIGLLFGFCSGQVARIAYLPRIAAESILLTVVPVLIVLIASGDPPRIGLAMMMALFTAGSMESVRASYRQARKRIAMLIDMEAMATADPLTGLCNRFGLRREIEAKLHEAAAARSWRCIASIWTASNR